VGWDGNGRTEKIEKRALELNGWNCHNSEVAKKKKNGFEKGGRENGKE
jgi:hypothetical protein